MKHQPLLIILALFLLQGCSTLRLQEKGSVYPEAFRSKFDFETYKGIITLDVNINGKSKAFLFDSGADLSVIQRDTIIGKTSKYAGASKRKMELGTEMIPSMKIGNVEYRNTYALTGDMVGLKEQVPNFGGILGQPIIQKANWMIDYPNAEMEMSNQQLADESFKAIKIIRENGNNPYTFLEINGEMYKVVIDLGSSSVINLPEDSEFAKGIVESIPLSDHTRGRYTLGGVQEIVEKIGVIPSVKIGDFEFNNVDVNINVSSQPRIGMRFFKDYKVYIDNTNGTYKLKRTRMPKEILFVCTHGAARSPIATAYFNRLSEEKNLNYRAVFRGTEPDKVLTKETVDGLSKDEFQIDKWRPAQVASRDIDRAYKIVTFDCTLPTSESAQGNVLQWNGIPSISKDYDTARDAIKNRVEQLIEQLIADEN